MATSPDEQKHLPSANFYGAIGTLVISLWALVGEKFMSLCQITSPMVFSSILLYAKSFICMYFLGLIGETATAAGSLSIAFANITGYSILKGLATAMDPICSQAYGAQRRTIICQIFRRTVLLLLLLCIPISLLWLTLAEKLLKLVQDEKITSATQVYIKYSVLELIAHAFLYPLRTFLKTQKITRPITITTFCAMLLHIPITYILAINLNLGAKGVSLASAWYTLNIDLGLLFYLILSEQTLKPWDAANTGRWFEGWRQLFELALPSMIVVCLEWWWYEIMSIFCGLLDDPKASVAAMGILIQLTSLLYVFPSSLSSGLSTLVGHELGADKPIEARVTTFIGIFIALCMGCLSVAFTNAVKDIWGKMYSVEPYTLYLISTALPILGLCEIGNCIQTAACGVLIGSARPERGSAIVFLSFYCIGLPTAVYLARKWSIGFLSIWYGLAAAQGSCMIMMILTLVFTDWKRQAERARELIHSTGELENNLEASLLT